MKKKPDAASVPPEAASPSSPERETVRARITTDRGPFWQERPLKRNEVTELPPALFALLEARGWAVGA